MLELEDKYNELLHTGNSIYDKACKLKDIAHKSRKDYKVYFQASEQFDNAAVIYKKLTIALSKSENVKNYADSIQNCEIFSEYYLYEKEQCLTACSYEERDIERTKEHYENNQKHLKKAISFLEKIQRDDELERQLKVWKFFEKMDVPYYFSILARYAWDRNDVVAALDYYREALQKSKQVEKLAIHLVDTGILEPVYKKISIGNSIGMAASISSALAMLIHEKYHNDLTANLTLKLLHLFLQGYSQSNAAYEANPEWYDYQEGSEIVYNNIRNLLNSNKKNWKDIFSDQLVTYRKKILLS